MPWWFLHALHLVMGVGELVHNIVESSKYQPRPYLDPTMAKSQWEKLWTEKHWPARTQVRLGVSNNAEYWGMGMPPWELVKEVGRVCDADTQNMCTAEFNVTTSLTTQDNEAPAPGHLTVALEARFAPESKLWGKDGVLDALGEALKAMYDPMATDFLPFATKNEAGEVVSLRYEPIYVAPARIVLDLDPKERAWDIYPYISVSVHSRDIQTNPASVCLRARDRVKAIKAGLEHKFQHGPVRLDQLVCIWPRGTRDGVLGRIRSGKPH